MAGKRTRVFIFIFELFLWFIFVLAASWLWDRWFIPGPHGPVRWVGMDFVPYWAGVRAMLHGHSPYLPETTSSIQSILFNGPVEVGADPMVFAYPALLFLPLIPLALLPLQWAVAIWTGSILFGTLHLIGFMSFQWGGKQIGWVAFWAFCLTIGSLPFLAIAATKGQIGLFSLGALFLVNHFSKCRSFLAGGFLGLAVLKPTLTILPACAFLLWAILERKPKLLIGFLSSIGVFLFASLLAVGNWIPEYLSMVGDTGGAPILWSLSTLAWPWKGFYFLLFAGILFYSLMRLVKTRDRSGWFSASILAGMALLPMRWIYDLVIGLLIPANERSMRGWLAVIVAAALIAPWIFSVVPENARWDAMVIGLPSIWALVWMVQTFRLCRQG